MPKFSIITVNYNSGIFLAELIESFKSLSIAPDDFEFIIIDNASADDSLARVNWGTLQKKIIANKQNLGFSRANNQGINLSQGRYVVLLNQDTKLLNDIFSLMEGVLSSDRAIGICAPKIFYPDGKTQISSFSFPSIPRQVFLILGITRFLEKNRAPLKLLKMLKVFFPDSAKVFLGNFDTAVKPMEVPWVSGACVMIKREVIDNIGLLDENFFAYAEDEDFCLRARKSGYKTYYAPQARLIHHVGWRRFGRKTKQMLDCNFKSLEYLYKKHFRGLKKYILLFLNRIDWLVNDIKTEKITS